MVAHPLDPFEIEAALRQRGADRAADVRPALRPVEARAAKDATLGARGRKIHAEPREEFEARRRHLAPLVAKHDQVARRHRVRQGDAEHAGDVVVAGARMTHLLVDPTLRLKARRRVQRDVHDAFEHLPDLRPGQAIVTVASLLHLHDEVGGGELAEMPAGGLRRHAGREGQLARGQRAAAQQRAQHAGARGVAHQGGDFGDLRGARHGPNIGHPDRLATGNTSAAAVASGLTGADRSNALDHGIAQSSALLLVSAIGIGSTAGRFLLGGLANRLGHARTLVATYLAMAVALVMWLDSTTFWPLALFGLIFGSAYGGWVALLPPVVMDEFGSRHISGVIGILY